MNDRFLRVIESHALIWTQDAKQLFYLTTIYNHKDLYTALNRPHFLSIHLPTTHIFVAYSRTAIMFEEDYEYPKR